jgi:hypothetical protein
VSELNDTAQTAPGVLDRQRFQQHDFGHRLHLVSSYTRWVSFVQNRKPELFVPMVMIDVN